MSLTDRFTCALVCKAWAEAATAATHSIILKERVFDFSCLQRWLEKHGNQLKVLQLHQCRGITFIRGTALAALPCEQLQDLLLHQLRQDGDVTFYIDSRVSSDIAAATKLTSVSLSGTGTESQQADLVAALTALPHLKQLTWSFVHCSDWHRLRNSSLLQRTTQLTYLKLEDAAPEAFEHLGSLTKLQCLVVKSSGEWAWDGFLGLQKLKALTRLELGTLGSIPAGITQLTALQQLSVSSVQVTALNGLQSLTGLTQLCVQRMKGLAPESPPLQLPGVQHLELIAPQKVMPLSFTSSCTQLRVLCVHFSPLIGPGRLLASSLLQHLELNACSIDAAADAAARPGGPVSWQQVFSAAGQLPHLTSLELRPPQLNMEQADIECVVSCCSSLQVLRIETLQDSFAPVLARLSGLTSLQGICVNDQQCSSLAQLTGLRELKLHRCGRLLSAAGVRQLAALEQLTSLAFLGCFGSHWWPLEVGPDLMEQTSDGLVHSCTIINKVCTTHSYRLRGIVCAIAICFEGAGLTAGA